MSEESKNLQQGEEFQRGSPGWAKKFAVAGRGIYVAVSQEKSFIAHFGITGAVIVLGLVFGLSRIEWCIITLAVMAGLSTELLNTAIERLSLAVTREYSEDVRDSLDIASGAVTIISIGAATLGVLVLGNALWEFFFR